MEVAGISMMFAGAILGLLSGIGVARLPSTLARIHAAAKPASLGLALVAVGAGFAAESLALLAVAVLIVVFQFLTAPIAGHLLGRSAIPALLEPEDAEVRETSHGRRLRFVLLAVTVWVALWRDPSVPNLLGGLIVGLLVAGIAGNRGVGGRVDLLGATRTLAGYAVGLVVANLRVARQVLTPSVNDLVETIVYCDLHTREQAVAFFDANAISFSPGTLTLELTGRAPYRMVVHALGQDAGAVSSEVAQLEAAGERMFGGATTGV